MTKQSIFKKIAKFMDKLDPLNTTSIALNDNETLYEFTAWKPHCLWCSDTGTFIYPTGFDNFHEDKGDKTLYRFICEFNEGRRLWAINKLSLCEDGNEQKRLQKYITYVTKANNAAQLANFVKLFKALFDISSSKLNTQPDVLGSNYGVIDMDTSSLCQQEDKQTVMQWYVTKRINADVLSSFTDIKPEARWRQFVYEIMSKDTEKTNFLQRALGYSIYGGNPEECMFIAWGATTRNGKSTLLNAIIDVLGDYASAVPSNFLLTKRNESDTDDVLASLVGKRFVVSSEPKEGVRFDEAKIKALTGNDVVTTSRKFGHTFSYTPEFTLWLNCNRLPEIKDVSLLASGRVFVIPFEVHFDRLSRDSNLKQLFKTREARTAIIEWLLEGYQSYKDEGLNPPECILRNNANYNDVAGNSLDRFIRTCCKLETTAKVEVNIFKETYQKWCENHCEAVLSTHKMTQVFNILSCVRRKSNGKVFLYGITISEQENEE